MSGPRRRFGQHFLVDRRARARMVAEFAPAPGQRIVEIGPGRGALTQALAASGAAVTAVEIDRDLARELRRRCPRVAVINADILEFDWRTLGDGEGDGEGHRDGDGDGEGHRHSNSGGRAQPKLRLIGNLPYNIATELIFRLLAQLDGVADMQFMVQREVAMRLCAAPGGKNYGRLTVMTAMQLDCVAVFDVPPAAFDPPPKVDSTVVRLTPKARPLQSRDPRRLQAVVAAAFGQRRKTLRNALAGTVTPAQFARAGVDPGLRAEKLSAQDFIALADAADG